MPIELEQLIKSGQAKAIGNNVKHHTPEVGSELFELSDSSILYSSQEDIPSELPRVFIAVTPPGSNLLLSRRIGGRARVRDAAVTGESAMKLLISTGFFQQNYDFSKGSRDRIIEACLERGAIPFWNGRFMPWEGIHRREQVVKVSFGVTRYQRKGSRKWEVRKVKTTKPFKIVWKKRSKTLLIGNDCTASARSICGLIEYVHRNERRLKVGGGSLKNVLIIDACISSIGIKRCHQTCLDLGLKAIFVCNSAIIDLVIEKGYSGLTETDLPILRARTIAPRSVINKAKMIYFGIPFCSVGDFTLGLEDPDAYTMETLVDMMRANWPVKRELRSGFVWEPNPWTDPYFHQWLTEERIVRRRECREALQYFRIEY